MRRLLMQLTALCALLAACTSPAAGGGAGEHGGARGGAGGGAGGGGASTAVTAGAGSGRTYAYGDHPRQRLTVYRDHAPRGATAAGHLPGVVVLHGGFWFMRPPPRPNAWAQRIANAGTAVFDVDYRSNRHAAWPAQRKDVLRALSWIRGHAHGFHVDPHRLVLLGSSAGGHLATSVGAYGNGRRRVAGVVALSPVADPYRAWKAGAKRAGPHRKALGVRTNAELLAGCVPRGGDGRDRARCRRTWRDMSAVAHASGADDAPMLLIHSRDDFVPVGHSRALARAERRRGMPARDVTVLTEPGHAHGGELMGVPGVAPRVLHWIAERTHAPHVQPPGDT